MSTTSNKESCDVLNEDVSGSYVAYGVQHSSPEGGLGSGNSFSGTSVRDVLAGKSSTDEVNSGPFFAFPPLNGGAYIVMSGDIGPVFGEDLSAVGVDFDLSYDSHAGAFQTQFESADA
ncbi:hypothetical protein SEA_MODRAGONS_73 [Mycobacterium phage Modragons]|nr:hypothetical protein SEA_MODRAGONS_73 [Mycobacterium phage Modragons]